MGFISKIKKEVGRSKVATAIGVTFLGPIGLQLGLFEKEVEKRVIEPMQESKRAQKEAAQAARELQELRRGDLLEQRFRQQRALSLTRMEQAKSKRISMAESIVGEEIGMISSAPVDGPNMAANKIPVLDPVDDMGNTIPEV